MFMKLVGFTGFHGFTVLGHLVRTMRARLTHKHCEVVHLSFSLKVQSHNNFKGIVLKSACN